MSRKVFPIIFGFLFALILAIFVLQHTVFNNFKNVVRPKVVNPIVKNGSTDFSNSQMPDSADILQTSFVPLLPSETLISSISFDFDSDNFDDQVVAVHKAGTPFIYLIIGLYEPASSTYSRSAEIATEITKERTFYFNGLDMIGEHRNSLVYQGQKNNGDSVMCIFMCRRRRGNVELFSIADFSSDGTIFIQQNERSDSYSLSQTKGESFSIWVYSSDKSEDKNLLSSSGVSQIQSEYKWNSDQEKYVQIRQLRVTGSRLAAKELERIQNGNVETFARFLNGLWYKTSSSTEMPSYIYINYDDREVIFLNDDTEGVYSWVDSNLRRSGIYITAVNSIISSMKRRFDIILTGANEVSIHVHDSVGMIIKESNQWDGVYKKMSFQNTFGEINDSPLYDQFYKALTNSVWTDENGNDFEFIGNLYKVKGMSEGDGIFVFAAIGNDAVIQIRGIHGANSFNGAYVLKFEEKFVQKVEQRNRTSGRLQPGLNTDVIILNPVNISPDICYAREGNTIVLKRISE